MPPAIVQHAEAAAVTASQPVTIAKPTAGNLLIAWDNSDAVVSIADNGSNAWTKSNSVLNNNAADTYYRVATATDAASLTTVTFSPTVSDTIHCGVLEIAGIVTSSPFDVGTTGTIQGGTTHSPVMSNITTTGADGDFVICFAMMHGNFTTMPSGETWSNSYTDLALSTFGVISGGVSVASFISTLNQATAGLTTTQATWVTLVPDCQGIILSFKAAPAAGSTSGPNYAATAIDLADGTGSWTNPTNADGTPDATYATWTAP